MKPSRKLNKSRTLRRTLKRCMKFSPYIANPPRELENYCANLKERDRQEYQAELISSRNSSGILKHLEKLQKKFPLKIFLIDWNSVTPAGTKIKNYSTRIYISSY